MSLTRKLFIFGVIIAVLPYLGFPYFWKNVLFTLLGMGLAVFAYLLHRDARKKNVKEKTFDNFSENSDFKEN